MKQYNGGSFISLMIGLILFACNGKQQSFVPTITSFAQLNTVKQITPMQAITLPPTLTSPPSNTQTPTQVIEFYDFETETTIPPFGFIEAEGLWNGKSPILNGIQIEDTTSRFGKKSLRIFGDKNTNYWAILIKPILPIYNSIEVSYYVKGNNIRKESNQYEQCKIGFIVFYPLGKEEFIFNGYDGTFPWRHDSIYIPFHALKSFYENSSSIFFGIFLSMSGELWVDDLKFVYEVLPLEVPTRTAVVELPSTPSPTVLPRSIIDSKGVEMVLVPAGEFKSGLEKSILSDEIKKHDIRRRFSCKMGEETGQIEWYCESSPSARVDMDNFYIDITEVTNKSYRQCVMEKACDPPNVSKSANLNFENYFNNPAYDNYPVVMVNYKQAKKYCSWREKRLPTRLEWEKAARGSVSLIYPWGNEFKNKGITYCNSSDCFHGVYRKSLEFLKPVGSNLIDKSPYGVLDLAGNVAEWAINGRDATIVGGCYSCSSTMMILTTSFRWDWPQGTANVGFRCAFSPSHDIQKSQTTIPTPLPKRLIEGLPDRFIDEQNIEMALIPAGEVEINGKKVYLEDYYIDIYEVTNEKFVEFLNAFGNRNSFGMDWLDEAESNGIYRTGRIWRVSKDKTNNPVTGVSIYGALAFCTWRNGSLPTEAQWIKAAQGGLEGKRYPWGNAKADCTRANFNYYRSSGFTPCVGDTTPVGSYPPNGFGLFDMAGNVMEWIADIYGRSFGEKISEFDPFYRIMHGGNYAQSERFLEHLSKSVDPRGEGNGLTGFRCVRLPYSDGKQR